MGLREALAKVAYKGVPLRNWTPSPPPTSPAPTQTPIPAAASEKASPPETPDVPGSWFRFGKVAIVTGAVVCGAAVAVAGAPVLTAAPEFTARRITASAG